jgi:ArsR family transcriptional regulator, arsenate/arsenite/antimonite-responsive transcriptional repressor
MNTEFEKDLENKAKLFKALGHPMRLIILNLIKERPRHGQELATILSLNPATISHHLTALVQAGLLSTRKDQYYQVFSTVPDSLEKPLSELVYLPAAQWTESVKEDAYKKKVLRAFMHDGVLSAIPAQRKKQQIILEEIVQAFEYERRYTEKEVNHILVDVNEDVAALRRGMIDFGLMERSQGIYWRNRKKTEDACGVL